LHRNGIALRVAEPYFNTFVPERIEKEARITWAVEVKGSVSFTISPTDFHTVDRNGNDVS
jgi:hypothetical protein